VTICYRVISPPSEYFPYASAAMTLARAFALVVGQRRRKLLSDTATCLLKSEATYTRGQDR
jgi:hypothetical protein